jgi:hypothetical protein
VNRDCRISSVVDESLGWWKLSQRARPPKFDVIDEMV